MVIYPAIDLKDGQCVRLIQGRADAKTVYSNDPAQIAASFEEQGAEFLHVVDLDGAFTGSPSNAEAIKKIADTIKIPFQVGGGLRSFDDVKRVLDLGASRVIIGTSAVKNQQLAGQLLQYYGPEQIILGIDARDGMVAVEGWVETSALTAVDFGRDMKELGIDTCVFTDISRDGLLTGPNLTSTREMAEKTGLKIIASGGVAGVKNITDLKALEDLGVVGVIIGKALYEGKMNLTQALAEASR